MRAENVTDMKKIRLGKYGDFLVKATQRMDDIRDLQAAGLICQDGDFVPSVHYPPITQYPPTTEDELLAGYNLPEDGLLDIYVHFPFCEQRCIFCHYPTRVGEQTKEKNRYLTALEREMDIALQRLGIDRIKARSILVGGGTPTFLTPEQLHRFLQFFCDRVDLTQCTQFNYDVEPGTLVGQSGLERLRIMKEYGVDRLTIGVQSLDDNVLKIMNRPPDARTAIEAIENSKKFGYQLNIEFIFGHSGETLEKWFDVIEKAVTLPVDEIQLYRLKVMAYGDLQGKIIKLRKKDPSSIPSFEDTMMMKQMAIDILTEHGFYENLRRVYTKKKDHYSHYAYNQCCMLYDQIGFGITAFSSLRDRFALNTQYFDEYYACIEKGKLPINRGIIRNKETQVRWAIVLPLKNSELKKAYFEKATGIPFDTIFRKKVERLKHFGLIEEDEEIVRLTELGAFVADEVVEQFNANEFMPFSRDAYAEGPLHPYADNTSVDALGSSKHHGESKICVKQEQIPANNLPDTVDPGGTYE
jgi:oxygen-independent coproporphyrinogen-3 oxidase